MTQLLANIFDTTGFPPRWHCGQWSDSLGWTHIIADLLTWGSYTAIPIVLGYFAFKRRDVPYSHIFWLFGVFIFACGTVHLVEAIMFWWPIYRASAVIKVITAIVSVGTVIALVPIAPKALALPGLARLNEQLQNQIEERIRFEQALKDSEARYRAVVDTAVDAIITIDANGTVETANPSAMNMFGYSREELIGNNVNIIMPAPYHGEHDQYLASYLKTGERKIIGIGREVQGRRKDGTTFPIDLAVSEMAVADRRMFTGIARDITHRKKVEAELIEIAEELERKSRERQEFFAILAHDMKHPVISIQGLLGLIRKDVGDKLDEESADNLNMSLSECDRMRDMLARISGLGKLDLAELKQEWMELPKLIEGCVDRFRAKLTSQNITLRIDAPTQGVHLPRWHVEQSLVNLIDNAINYGCPETGARIDITVQVDANRCVIKVRDYGPGIHPRNHPRVFEPFRRLSPTTGPAGSGIGLTAVRQLMNRIDGRVTLESDVGQGATFSLSFGIS